MGREAPAPSGGIRAEDGADLGQAEAELPEAPDEPGVVELRAGVGAVRGLGIDAGGLEQPDLVVMAQGADAQPAEAREATDRQELVHVAQSELSGRSRVKRPGPGAGPAQPASRPVRPGAARTTRPSATPRACIRRARRRRCVPSRSPRGAPRSPGSGG